jgi:alpha-ketoglutaric semialdehyde dehydrogenase
MQGTSFIGYTRGAQTGPFTSAINPATRETIEPGYAAPSAEEVESAIHLAHEAFPIYRMKSAAARAEFLRKIATEIESVADEIAARGCMETGLPEARLRGETGRTVGQLRLFASMLDDGSWLDARIEHAMPDRAPIPKPDIRSMMRPLGPVAVFCASNFPLAYSVAGGDSASALAVGCPVIVKAHSSHPGTAEIVAGAVIRAAQACGMPEGVFSVLYGSGVTVGAALVKHPSIKAVGFTGSHKGGRALMDMAAARPEPIPVYAEMSSINPVVFLPHVLQQKADALAEGFFQSLTLGVGQFCTNPGMVLLPRGSESAFITALQEKIAKAPAGVMLNAGICQAYQNSTASAAAQPGVTRIMSEQPAAEGCGLPQVLVCDAATFLQHDELTEEMFGPASLLITGSAEELLAVAESLEGQLTASIHGTDEDFSHAGPILEILERKAGRLIFNGFPTGVEVCHSMVHGGPYPSTSDGRSTSVGTMAATRFTRAVAWQSTPDALLPDELKESNPLGIPRMVDGKRC